MKQCLLLILAFLVVAGSAVWAQARFSDVPAAHPHVEAIEWAAEAGYFFGYPDGTFRPDRLLTAEQAATVFLRAFPDGVTRGELAEVLISHRNKTSCGSHWDDFLCQIIPESPDVISFRVEDACNPLTVTVWAASWHFGYRISDKAAVTVFDARPGQIISIELPEVSQPFPGYSWEWSGQCH